MPASSVLEELPPTIGARFAAALIGCSHVTVYEEVRRGRLAAIPAGSHGVRILTAPLMVRLQIDEATMIRLLKEAGWRPKRPQEWVASG